MLGCASSRRLSASKCSGLSLHMLAPHIKHLTAKESFGEFHPVIGIRKGRRCSDSGTVISGTSASQNVIPARKK